MRSASVAVYRWVGVADPASAVVVVVRIASLMLFPVSSLPSAIRSPDGRGRLARGQVTAGRGEDVGRRSGRARAATALRARQDFRAGSADGGPCGPHRG